MKVLTFFFLFLSTFSFAQNGLPPSELNINWGPDNDRKSNIYGILPEKGFDFYAFRISNNRFFASPKVSRYIDGKSVLTKSIDQKIDNNIVLLEDIITFNGNLIGFLSDKRGSVNSLYMVRYDTEIDPLGSATEIATYAIEKGWSRGSFRVIVSDNKHFLCVEYLIPGKREQFDRFGYKVIDTNYREISSGEYELPYNSRSVSIDLRHVTNTGDYLLGVSISNVGEKTIWRDYSTIDKTILVHVIGDSVYEYDLQIDQKRVFNFGINSVDSLLMVTGTFGEPFSAGAQGVFFQRINLKSKKSEKESFQEFPKLFLSQEQTDNQNFWGDNRQGNRTNSDLLNYAFRALHPQADGSIVVVLEQFYIYQQSSTDARGISQNINHYYYEDIVTYRMDSTGVFQWIVKIPKEQHSTNDYGYFSSIKTLVHNDKLVCFFNDNRKNYTDFGEFIDFDRSINFPVRKKSYAFAVAEVNLLSGEVQRRMFNDYSQTNGFVVLKLSPIDYRNNQLLIYSTGKKERFGLMQF